jgi:hypothetical protein
MVINLGSMCVEPEREILVKNVLEIGIREI